MAESARAGWLYNVLDRAGVRRISLGFARPFKGPVDWECEVCEVKNFARCALMTRCINCCSLELLWDHAILLGASVLQARYLRQVPRTEGFTREASLQLPENLHPEPSGTLHVRLPLAS